VVGILRQLSGLGLGGFLLWIVAFQLTESATNPAQKSATKPEVSRAWVHPFDIPQGDSFPDEVTAVIEIPLGSFTKYEIDPASGIVAVDRFQSMPVVYPANYGVITSSLAGDGDNLDVLVFSREAIVPGALVRVRPVGVLKMLDGGEEDDKIIAVPTSQVDPTYNSIQSIHDLPEIDLRRIESFFRVYKQLPEKRKIVELNGFRDAAEAKMLIERAIQLYRS